jgi:hypothetical protein
MRLRLSRIAPPHAVRDCAAARHPIDWQSVALQTRNDSHIGLLLCASRIVTQPIPGAAKKAAKKEWLAVIR